MAKNSVQAMPMISYDTSLLSGSYVLFTPAAGIAQSLSLVRFINNSSKDITISYDGTTDHDFVPTLITNVLPFQNISAPNNNLCMMPKGTKVWIKGSAGTGDFYMAGYYQAQGV